MNEDRFHELLNEYLDGEISREGFEELKKAIGENPKYRKLFDEYRRLQLAEKAIFAGKTPAKNKKKSPALFTGFFAPARLLRSAGILANCSILLLTVGLYRTPNFNENGMAASYFPDAVTTGSPDNSPHDRAPESSHGAVDANGGPVVIAQARPKAPEQIPAGSPDSASGSVLAEEYGFVRF